MANLGIDFSLMRPRAGAQATGGESGDGRRSVRGLRLSAAKHTTPEIRGSRRMRAVHADNTSNGTQPDFEITMTQIGPYRPALALIGNDLDSAVAPAVLTLANNCRPRGSLRLQQFETMFFGIWGEHV